MDMFRKLLGAGVARVAVMTVLIVAVGGVYLMPRGDATGGWIYTEDGPMVNIGPMPVVNKKGASATIAGIGFKPGQELGLRIFMGGVMSDISFQVKPEPKTDKEGSFYSVWKFGRELNLLGTGAHKLMVVDQEGQVIAQTMLVVENPPKKAKPKKK